MTVQDDLAIDSAHTAATAAGTREKILLAGDAVAPTGFSRVLRSIFEPLKDDYEIHHLAVNYFGDPHDYPWSLYPARNRGHVFGVNRLAPMIAEHRPQLVFLLNDLWILADSMRALEEVADLPPIVLYCPVETVEPEPLRHMSRAQRFVVYTETARRQVELAVAEIRRRDPGFFFPPVEVIPHGVDTGTFHPLHTNLETGWTPEGRAEVRRRAYRSDDFRDAFLVLNANRNQPRKRIDLTLEGFARFAQGKPDNVRLHLHMGLEDLGWHLPALAERHGVAERLILSTRSRSMPGIREDELNLIYNACDVGLNTATSEGWGLVSFEHAATGAAQIVPDHSVLGELWRGRAEMMAPCLTLVDPTTQGEESYVDPEAVAAALERLYADRGHLDSLSRAAHAHATRGAYRWPAISARWHHLLNACLAESIRA